MLQLLVIVDSNNVFDSSIHSGYRTFAMFLDVRENASIAKYISRGSLCSQKFLHGKKDKSPILLDFIHETCFV